MAIRGSYEAALRKGVTTALVEAMSSVPKTLNKARLIFNVHQKKLSKAKTKDSLQQNVSLQKQKQKNKPTFAAIQYEVTGIC